MIGVDEVGRGCLAGPLLVVAAKAHAKLPGGVKDSKELTRNQRQKLLDLLSICCSFGEGWVSVGEINRLGLAAATRLGVARALRSIKAQSKDNIVIDGHINYCPKKFTNARQLINADATVAIVSAASIYAKVTRDKFMTELSAKHVDYGFERHVGYGTKFHLAALRELGPVAGLHRMNFSPLKELNQ